MLTGCQASAVVLTCCPTLDVVSARSADGPTDWFEKLDELLERQGHGAVKKLAALLGKDASQVSHYRAGRRLPDLQEVATICTTFGVSADWLLGLDETKGPQLGIPVKSLSAAAAHLAEAQRLLGAAIPDTAAAAELEQMAHRRAELARQQTTSVSSSSQTSGKGRGRSSRE